MKYINNKSVSILALSDKIEGGGSIKRYNMLIREFVFNGYNVYHLSPYPIHDIKEKDYYHHIRIIRPELPPKVINFLLLSIYPLWRVLRDNSLKVAVLSNTLHAAPIIILRKFLSKNFKIIISIRGDIITATKFRFSSCEISKIVILPYIKLLMWIEKYAIINSDLVIFQSYFDRERYSERYQLDTRNKLIKVIPNAIDTSELNCMLEGRKHIHTERVIGYVGRLSRIKGVQFLIMAFSKLLTSLGKIKLVIIGDGPEKVKLVKLTLRLGCYNHVEWIEWVDNVSQYLNKINILVVPSLFDVFPNVILEGLSCNNLVIGARVGGIIEILKEDELLFEPGNPDDLANKLKKILTDVCYFKRLKNLCEVRKQAFIFNWGEKYLSAIREIIGENG